MANGRGVSAIVAHYFSLEQCDHFQLLSACFNISNCTLLSIRRPPGEGGRIYAMTDDALDLDGDDLVEDAAWTALIRFPKLRFDEEPQAQRGMDLCCRSDASKVIKKVRSRRT